MSLANICPQLSLVLALLFISGCVAGESGISLATSPVPTKDTAVDALQAQPTATNIADEEPEPLSPAPGQAMYKGLPVGFTAEGYPFRGDPNAAITIYEYSDYQCPFCARHVIQTEPALLARFVEAGLVKFVFRDMPLSSLHPNALPAAIAANCVAEQDIILFWQMHDQLFFTQQEWASLDVALSFFAELVQEIGADATQYGACMANTAVPLARVSESLTEAQSFGFSGTPSFRFVREETGQSFSLRGAQPYDVFAEWIETIRTGGSPPGAAASQQQGSQQVPFWATAEGLRPDPQRPGYTVAGDTYYGNSDAPLVVIEFSDFQCPYCRRHTLTTQPILDEEFIKVGDVMWVFKHFPIENIHPYAFSASIAAECAGRQNAFWTFHKRLFEDTEEWSQAENSDYFIELAAASDLDTNEFATCLTDDAVVQDVQHDIEEGLPFVRGTPTFIVLYSDQGRLIPGALPTDQFVAALTEILEENNASGE